MQGGRERAGQRERGGGGGRENRQARKRGRESKQIANTENEYTHERIPLW